MALRKVKVTNRSFLRVILTSKNEKLFKDGVSYVDFTFFFFEFIYLIKNLNALFI